MPNAVRTLDDRHLTIGIMALALEGRRQGSVAEQVHDGDTVLARPVGHLSLRFLGIDTPEISFRLPGESRPSSLKSAKWDEFLRDPFADKWPPFEPPLSDGLPRHFRQKAREGAAANHRQHAEAAERALEREIRHDIQVLGQDEATFQFFVTFAYEVMDSYGRFLCYVNRDQPQPNDPEPRPLTYNERLLKSGHALPYYIWPNVNPWRKQPSIIEAVVPPSQAKTMSDDDSTLSRARDFVRAARAQHRGVFDAMDPLLFEPFELRLLAGRRVPMRWVIDLSRNDDVLLPPQSYYTIPQPEDRLFIPAEFVPLFIEKGWRRGTT